VEQLARCRTQGGEVAFVRSVTIKRPTDLLSASLFGREQVNILALNGSRRKQGNTAILLQTILHPLQRAGADVETIFLGDYRIEACSGCEGCSKSWDCVIKDDYAALVKKLDGADGMILGSPTYWYSVTSDMKRFIDRSYSLIQFPESRRKWISKYQQDGKACVTAAVCEQLEESMMGSTLSLLSDFSRDIGLKLVDSIAALHCFEAGSIRRQSDLLQRAERAGEKLLMALHG
jgi:multimeric flavodoxin WrbA